MRAPSDYPITVKPLAKELGGGFIALAPDLPGCFSDGETQVEAVENCLDAIACWIEGAIELGHPVPVPHREFA